MWVSVTNIIQKLFWTRNCPEVVTVRQKRKFLPVFDKYVAGSEIFLMKHDEVLII